MRLAVAGPRLLSYESYSHITNYLERFGANLVDRVFGGMPIGVVEIHDVDRVDSHFLQCDVIIGERVPHIRHELALVSPSRRDAPHAPHDLGREGERVTLLVDLQILVPTISNRIA